MGSKLSRKQSKDNLLRQIQNQCKTMASNYPITSDDNNGVIEQWINKVTKYSSQYDANKWCASLMCGPPKVYPNYGDKPGAWASAVKDANQFVEVEFQEAVFVTKIDIYETYHAGGVKAIKALNDLGKWQTLYSTNRVTSIKQSRIFTPELMELDCMTSHLRIEIDCTACGTWVELDAVQLHGKRFRTAPPPSMDVLADDLSNLINNQQFSDVEFYVEDKIVYGHKSIMCVRSDYFRAMFTHNTKDAKATMIKLPDVSHDIFMAVISYIYTNRLPDTYNGIELTEIWRAADRFSLEGLKLLIAFKISEKIDENNVVDVYVATSSKLPVIEEIQKNCLSYMSSNMAKIVNKPSFVGLDQQTMLEIIQVTTAKLHL